MRASRSKDFILFRRLLREARPFWGHILLIFGVSVFHSAVGTPHGHAHTQ